MTAATRAPLAALGAVAALAALPCAATAAEVTPAPAISGAASLAQAALGLFAIIALILGLAWMARRAGLVRHATGGAMKVVGSTMLGARQRLVLVEVGDAWLVLGVSPGEIRPLHTMAAGSPAAGQTVVHGATGPSQPPTGGSFAEKLLRSMQAHFKS
ncbi:flagellar biosynthetic protein FliO [Cupriavidus taiwanensis]|uniref:flagellar biosynthetic protein FliO n=1 Tax=Cupriavidus taiwanensis TaxID=164546 RepID=UPI000E166DED|nr:flagellar biosynthetic protein FliO [Cupriavidus taiwanensis]SOZ30041.1 FliO: Flagellar biosynthesis protein. fliO/mopB family [Cupriavidus taiwanensis]SPA34762.1 FliO: Flagellar biosynthesis protein. fliO/mopB family [Cupriavidus taiwanensis]